MDRKGSKREREKNPRQSANIISVITFFYTNALLKKGYKSQLEDTDIYEVLPKFSSKKLGDTLEDEWLADGKLRGSSSGKGNTSLLKLLVKIFGKWYFFWGVVQLCVRTSLVFILPLSKAKIVAYFAPGQTDITDNDLYQFAFLVIFLTIVSTIYNHNYQVIVAEIGMKVRTSVASLVYRKALRLGSEAMSKVTAGKIVTLITKDVFSFESAMVFLNDMWIGLVQIVVTSWLIYNRIGWSVMSGVIFYLMIVPLQFYVGKKSGQCRIKSARETDQRLQLTAEALSNVKTVKMYSWENFFVEKLNAIRKSEMKKLATVYYLKCIVIIIGGLATNISFFLLVMTYIWTGHYATAEIVYYIQSIFQNLKSYITISIPFGIAQSSEVYAALNRLGEFLDMEELKPRRYNRNIVKNPRVHINSVQVEINGKEILKDVSLNAEKGVVLIVGNVGSGKSTILKTIMGDYTSTKGDVVIQGTISYASQDPWLFPSTIKQNILFGQAFDEMRYNKVLNVCALRYDLSQFEQGDQTIVGDRGVNLSKGQQARICLARAIYKDSDIYLLDDCLAALDTQVSGYVFKKCILGFLKDKIVIAVTHNVNHIKFVGNNNVVILENGTTPTLEQQQARLDKRITFYIDDVNFDHFNNDDEKLERDDVDEKSKLLEKEENTKDLYHEDKQSGKVHIGVYLKYYRFAGGFLVLLFVVGVFTAAQTVMSYSDKVVSKWINIEPNLTTLILANKTDTPEFEETSSKRNSTLNLYCVLIIAGSILTFSRVYVNFFFAIKASRNLHSAMAKAVLNSVMSFFDRHFIGNVINRFSKDLNQIDEILPFIIYEVFRQTYTFIGIMVLIASVNVYLLIPGVFLVIKLYLLRRYYLPTGRNLKRLEAATRSPMIGYLNSTIEGLTTIRASDKQELLKNEFDRHQDLYTSTYYMVLISGRAFALWMDLISALFVTAVILKFVFYNTDAKAGDVGLAITQATLLTGMLQYMVRQYSDIENAMTSVERVIEYTEIKTENKKPGLEIQGWPDKGRIEFSNVCLTYETTKQQVLKNISFVIEANEKVGIVGRTGAGKSSIISSLFRLYDVEGSIIIDGIETKTVSLEYLRSQIAIIPQDPVLFSGTVRANVDPLNRFQDEQIWQAIEKVNLKNLLTGLDQNITENGSNFSSGQKQLICLSRALLSQCRIIVLDEATASMDPEVSALLLETLKVQFKDCTVITIAHRLNTVMGCDRVMVVDGGSIVEYDAPSTLLKDTGTMFYKMVKQSGLLDEHDE